MDCTRAQELLDDYVDGELPESLTREVHDHLPGYPACASSEAELRALLHRAAQLPPRSNRREISGPASGTRSPPDQPSRHLPDAPAVAFGWMAAAAVLLVLLSSAVTLWVVRHRALTPVPRISPASELVALRVSEPDYIQARRALVAAFGPAPAAPLASDPDDHRAEPRPPWTRPCAPPSLPSTRTPGTAAWLSSSNPHTARRSIIDAGREPAPRTPESEKGGEPCRKRS